MHLVLQLPELVRIVCQHVDKNDDLFHLLCCASVFCEPALDILWRDCHNLDNLLQCFPNTVWSETEGRPSKTLTLSRPFKPSDWDRFGYYAQRVRELDLQVSSQADEEVYDAIIASVSRPRYFLPRLMSLQILTCSFPWSLLDLLLAPTLKDVTLILEVERAALTLLYQIQSRSPNVTCLSVFAPEAYKHRGNVMEALSGCVTSYMNLEIVDVPCLSGRAVEHISNVKTLTRLTLGSNKLAFDPVFDLNEGAFPALEVLDLKDIPSQSSKLLRAISSPSLNSIHLILSGLCSRSAWAEVVDALAAVESRQTSLEKLYIEEFIDKDEGEAANVLSMNDLEPLLALRALTDFSIFPHKRLDLSNNDIERMAKAFPKLSGLFLGRRIKHGDDEPPCRVTMEALSHLVEHCPDLRELSIEFIASGLVPPPDKPTNKQITVLDITDSSISAEAIPIAAAYLSSLFPSLRQLYNGESTRERSNLWRKVEELLNSVGDIRSQEQM